MEWKELVWKIAKIGRGHRKIVEKKIATLGIHPSQHHFLMYLSRKGPSTQSDIAQSMEISEATVAVSLKKLEKGNYIEKRSNPEDKRCNKIVLTSFGEEAVCESTKMFKEVDSAMFEGFSEEDQKLFGEYLDRVLENMKKMEE